MTSRWERKIARHWIWGAIAVATLLLANLVVPEWFGGSWFG